MIHLGPLFALRPQAISHHFRLHLRTRTSMLCWLAHVAVQLQVQCSSCAVEKGNKPGPQLSTKQPKRQRTSTPGVVKETTAANLNMLALNLICMCPIALKRLQKGFKKLSPELTSVVAFATFRSSSSSSCGHQISAVTHAAAAPTAPSAATAHLVCAARIATISLRSASLARYNVAKEHGLHLWRLAGGLCSLSTTWTHFSRT